MINSPHVLQKWHSMRALLYVYDLEVYLSGEDACRGILRLSDIVQYDKIIMRVNFIDFQI